MSSKFWEDARKKVRSKYQEIESMNDAIVRHVQGQREQARILTDKVLNAAGRSDTQKFLVLFRKAMHDMEDISSNLFQITASLPTDETEALEGQELDRHTEKHPSPSVPSRFSPPASEGPTQSFQCRDTQDPPAADKVCSSNVSSQKMDDLVPIAPRSPRATPTGSALAVQIQDMAKPNRSPQQYGMGPDIQPITISNHETLDVMVTEVISINRFWMQLTKSDELDDLMAKLESYNANLTKSGDYWPLECLPRPGMIVCAQFSVDQLWYRARITAVTFEDQPDKRPTKYGAEVIYVDYGNVELIPGTRIRPLPAEFGVLPFQAILGSLSEVTSAFTRKFKYPGVLSPDIRGIIEKEIVSHSFTANVKCYPDCPIIFVDLFPASKAEKDRKKITENMKETLLAHKVVRVTTNEEIATSYNREASDDRGRGQSKAFLKQYEVDALQSPIVKDFNQQYKTLIIEKLFGHSTHSQRGYKRPVHEVTKEECLLKTVTKAIAAIPDEPPKLRKPKEIPQNLLMEQRKPASQPKGQLKTSDLPTYKLRLPSDHKMKFMVSHVESISSFYGQFCTKESAKCITDYEKRLNELYGNGKNNMNHLSLDELKLNDLVCAKYSDGKFYRAEVRSISQVSNTRSGHVDVFYIDFGNSCLLEQSDIYPLHPDFTHSAAQAVCCRLVGLLPTKDGGGDNRSDNWSQSSIKSFSELLNIDNNAVVVVEIFSKKNPDVLAIAKDEVLDVFLAVEKDGVFVDVGDLLVKRGFATRDPDPKFPPRYNIPGSASKPSGEKSDTSGIPPSQDFKHWNPMEDDYHEMRNSYDIDTDDAQVAVTGYKRKDEANICRNFNRPHGCRRQNCPYLHQKLTDTTTDKMQVVCISDSESQLDLPDIGVSVFLEMTYIIDPSHFYCNLVFGKSSALEVQKQQAISGGANAVGQKNEEFNEFSKILTAEYELSSHKLKTLILPAIGEIVAAFYPADRRWCRGRVIESDPENERVKVFLIDFGDLLWVDEKSIRQLLPKFSHLAPQAVEGFLPLDPAAPDGQWSEEAREFFASSCKGHLLIGKVLDRPSSSSLALELTTCGVSQCSINTALVKRGFAKQPLQESHSSSGGTPGTSDIRHRPG